MANDRGFFSITPRADQVERALRDLAHIKNGAPRAMSAALNKTATGAKTDTVKILSKIYTAKQKDIRQSVSIGRKASPANLVTTILGKHKPMPLMMFRIRPRNVTNPRPKRGIRAEIKRGQAKWLQYAFIATIAGKLQVASRKGRKRFPIKKLLGPSVPYMMDNDNAAEEVLTLAQARLDKALDHEIERIEKGFGK
ncbi:MAG: phage tail protein [Armatimonadota bacterium]